MKELLVLPLSGTTLPENIEPWLKKFREVSEETTHQNQAIRQYTVDKNGVVCVTVIDDAILINHYSNDDPIIATITCQALDPNYKKVATWRYAGGDSWKVALAALEGASFQTLKDMSYPY